jgi:DNA cross-link repair 1A protein
MYQSAKPTTFSEIPKRHKVIGTMFLVDAFLYKCKDVSHWFFTHFHSDHYCGLDRRFTGKIYCTPVTAQLVHKNLGIEWQYLAMIPFDQKFITDGVTITFKDANHCPGAAMILFHLPSGSNILHSGDMRFDRDMHSDFGTIDYLYLDTTYCEPKYCFPPQKMVIREILDIVKSYFSDESVLFLVGAYKIGKERITLEIAGELNCKIAITPSRYNDLKLFGISNFSDIYTLNQKKSRVHIVSVGKLGWNGIEELAEYGISLGFGRVVAVKPTGWSHSPNQTTKVTKKGPVTIWSLAYSEHSSFQELIEICKACEAQEYHSNSWRREINLASFASICRSCE